MPDREKVIETLPELQEFFEARADMALGDAGMLLLSWANCARDAYFLLKEQEPMEPKAFTNVIIGNGSDGFREEFRDVRYNCRMCGHIVTKGENNFCGYCGRALKWDAAD